VTHDSTAYDCFEVHKADGTKCVFKLFYSCVNNDVTLVTTVENNINKYTVREYSYAKKARDLQNIIGRPSTQDLQEWGFVLNPYDKCVAKTNIEGKQCTIIWHVDDLKISHADKNVVENILKKLNDKFGQESPLTTCRGKS